MDQKLPNIIYIMVDDLGWTDTGTYGSMFYETPNIDALARAGMTFTRGYAGAANCAPSRACLISGQNTPRHGIYTVGNSERGDSRTRRLIPIKNTKKLADSVFTLAEMLKSKGYITGNFGKWHLGEDPISQGFDVNIGGSGRGGPGGKGYFAPYNLHDLTDAPKGENLTDRLTKEAIHFMKGARETPFFAYIPYYAVHTPLATTEGLKRKYQDKKGNDRHSHAVYAGMIETVDNNVGRILDFLKSESLAENTFVVFTSDNGGIRGISLQSPLRAGKGSYYEGGIRVPFIFSWPGKIPEGTQNDDPISNLDIFPTLRELTGATLPDKGLDGISLVNTLMGEGRMPSRELFFHFPIYLQAYNPKMDDGRDSLFRTRPGGVILSGKWKLHEYFEDGGVELYDLEKDPGERTNLAHTHTDKAAQLLEKMRAWRSRTEAPVPIEANPKFDAHYMGDTK
ncbi:MAG: sulfatase [Bacteroidota bacterium]